MIIQFDGHMVQVFSSMPADRHKTVWNFKESRPGSQSDSLVVAIPTPPAHIHGVRRSHERFGTERVWTIRNTFYDVKNLHERTRSVRKHITIIFLNDTTHEIAGSFGGTICFKLKDFHVAIITPLNYNIL